MKKRWGNTVPRDEVTSFTSIVEDFCLIIESVGTVTNAVFLGRLEELLPELYAAAHGLPLDWGERRKIDHPVAVNELERTARLSIAARLGSLDEYTFVYDPVDPSDKEPHTTPLSGCIADVYAELKGGLDLYRLGDDEAVRQAIFEWRFGLEGGWGRHAAELLLPIHSLVHHHYDEDEGTFNLTLGDGA